LLLDIVPPGAEDRSTLAKAALVKLATAEPAPLMSKAVAKLIEAGNLEDDLKRLAECDWIIEAVTERLEVKQALYRKVDAARRPSSILSSNTSTLPLKMLVAGMPESLRRDFCITHFFNPPRYMRLLEIVAGPDTRVDAINAVAAFSDVKLGKSVVHAKDTPGFIANRIGVYWIQCAINAALEMGLSVEEADAVMGKPIGAPKSGVFDLLDIVGLDLQPDIDASLRAALPKSDGYQNLSADFPLLQKMISEGLTGRKGKGGFYRLNKAGNKKTKEAMDLKTGNYRPVMKVSLESVDGAKGGLRALVSHPDRGGKFAWTVLSQLLSYVAGLVPEIVDDVADVDLAMRTGFNWKRGPFELIDQLGAAWFAEKLAAEKMPVPPLLATAAKQGGFYQASLDGQKQLSGDGSYKTITRPAGALLLADIKVKSSPLAKNGSASVWDLGDGVACLEFHSKMNSIDLDTLSMAKKAIEIVSKGMQALVLYNDAENFSVGANIGLALFAANIGMWPVLDDLITQGQNVMKALKFAPFPVVGAPAGLALGGGCEFLLHCAAVQAHAETYMGLVEVGVGIVPGWGGCKEMLIRQNAGSVPHGPMPAVMAAFEQISLAKVSKSAANAKELKYLRKADGITMNRDRLLPDAKALALKLAADYMPPLPVELRLPGPSGKVALNMAIETYSQQGLALPHDVTVSGQLANVLSGGATDVTEITSEDRVMELERGAFMALVKTEPTLARIETMLATGKPLRN
jgi:3-hydroxyacyl-CoA dehydrogenase